MATIVLAAAGSALGASVGGTVLGISAAALGQAAGASLGQVVDQKLLGSGSAAVDTGRIDRFRLSNASEGSPIAQVYGRMRVGGQVIWATKFQETQSTSGGGKGSTPSVTSYSYTVSLAIALCEGEISRIGRVWADGVLVAHDDLNMRVYRGTDTQQADPKIVAVEGAGQVPAYRGVAYVVFEDLPLAPYGNRVPQFTFEVMRPSLPKMDVSEPLAERDLNDLVQGVALIPGSGEYALATTPVYMPNALGEERPINQNSPLGLTDFEASSTALSAELPNCTSSLLVVSWFGNDLRCGTCSVLPKVEQKTFDPAAMPWSVGGVTRAQAQEIAQVDNRPVYGGTPADASVIQAIKSLKDKGQRPVFYPFILMEQLENNGLENPWDGAENQPILPWRGRITLSKAPGREGSPDGTSAADQQVDRFMGEARPEHFTITGDKVAYSGPEGWGYRRFILHYAYLCKLAGGVSAFCIGSEMRGLTQIQGEGGRFPAVDGLKVLAGEVRAILGAEVKISYAADWSEYHGYQPPKTADKIFHLDPLWADEHIDFIGIDNYMPLADWRDGTAHADASFESIYNLDYLQKNVAGGEGYDWFYHSQEAREAQIRTPITDAHGEPWVWRYKDLKGWWLNKHHNRVNGQRAQAPTAWVPQSKPFWFTEYGCAAIDKGANQPNKFLDPKSSESELPRYSSGARDDYMQLQYIRAVVAHFSDATQNPSSSLYKRPMLDLSRAHVWAWDTRPFPFFPANTALWSDGGNYLKGHWLNGRSTNCSLASVVGELCRRSGVTHYDVSKLYGILRGYTVRDITTARSALQPLLQTYGIDVIERDGVLAFRNKSAQIKAVLSDNHLAEHPEQESAVSVLRAPAAENIERLQLEYIDAEGDYEVAVSEVSHSEDRNLRVSRSVSPLALTQDEADQTVFRWLSETRAAQENIRFALPPSLAHIGVGDVIESEITGETGVFRIDQVEDIGARLIEAVRIADTYGQDSVRQNTAGSHSSVQGFTPAAPVQLAFLDLPLISGDEPEHAPHVAASASTWPGQVTLFSSAQDSDYTFARHLNVAADMGRLTSPLIKGPVALWDRQSVKVQLLRGALSGQSKEAVLSGANRFAIGDGTSGRWEIVQAMNVTPLGDGKFELSHLLRGQFGTSAIMPDAWPIGAQIVVLNDRVSLYPLAPSARGTLQHVRYGPAHRPMSDSSYRYVTAEFRGNGLRPYPVVHMAQRSQDGMHVLSWVRQTRIDGDNWSGVDVPLGEESERYVLRIMQNGVLRREETLSAAEFTYSAQMQSSDLAEPAGYFVKVAQVSARYGTGPFSSLFVPQQV